jgi:hypothetical protein
MAIDWSTITNPWQAINLIFKKEDDYDIYQNNNIFQALVLTPGYSLTPREARSLQFSSKPRSAEDDPEADKNDESRLTRVFFKGRILGPNSPHSFLPNPCDIDAADDPEGTSRAIALHTTFVTTTDPEDATMPQPNDIYTVSLRGGDDDTPFNLQVGDALYRTASPPRATAKEKEACASIAELFKDMTAQVYYPPGQPRMLAGQEVLNGELPTELLARVDEKYSKPGILFIEIVESYNEMAKAFMEKFDTKFPLNQPMSQGWGGYRDLAAQHAAREKYGSPQAAYPGTSNHGWGLAFDWAAASFDSEYYKWMTANAKDFQNPSWALRGGSNPEEWHWEPRQTAYTTSDGEAVVAEAEAE